MNTNNISVMNPRVRVIPAKTRTSRNEENPDGQKKRVAAYARVSTLEEEQQSSYELQVSYYKELIENNPAWEFVKVYADEGISGTTVEHRAGFVEMIKHAKEGKFDYIITKSISRFSRNVLDCLQTLRELKELPNPVGVFFEKENIDTLDSKSELVLVLLASIAQEEAQSISQNVKWSIQKKFSRGEVHMPTVYFLGYKTDENGKIQIDEEQAEIVRRIFREFLNGKGTPTIAKELMRDGVLTARGNKTWTSNSVYRILTNEKMMGHCLTSKSYTTSYLTHIRKRNDGSFPQYYVRNTHPAIISEDDWHAVQEELKRRNKMLRDPDGKYRMTYSGKSPLSNTLFCGNCGRPLIRRRLSSTRKGKKYHYTVYHCRVASQRDPEFKDCNAKYLWEEAIEKSFMNALFQLKKYPEKVKEESKMFIASYQISEEEKRKLEELEKKIDVISARVTELVSMESVSNDPVYDVTLRSLIYEQEILEMEYERIKKNKQESLYYENKLKEILKYLETLDETEDKFRPDIYLKVIESGIVYENHEILFKFNCGIKRKVYAHKDILNNK
ncbi:recombinase family protein [Clostridium sp. DL1XJH146]